MKILQLEQHRVSVLETLEYQPLQEMVSLPEFGAWLES